ncbi:MAG: DNA-directed RNA polymerase [Steroidobacteraceae bacterium]
MKLLERQHELEYAAVMRGNVRYAEARKRRGESATRPGRDQTNTLIPLLAAAIRTFTEQAATRKGRPKAALPYLLHIKPEEAAYLTIRRAIDAAAADDERLKALTAVAVDIGADVQNHLNILKLADQAPAAYRRTMQQLKRSTAVWQRNPTLQRAINLYTADTLSWSTEAKRSVGWVLLKLFEEACELITIDTVQRKRKERRVIINFTADAAEWFCNQHKFLSAFKPIHSPMLVPPRDWTSPTCGGYLTNVIRGAHMVHTRSAGYLEEAANIDMPRVYAAINRVQSTPWRINKRPLRVLQSIPGTAYQVNLSRDKRKELTRKIDIAEKYVDEERFYFPHYLDFRGRMYPFASYLNPQADDVGRSLLEFADGKPLGERGLFWLKVHVANTFGIDKVSFEERVRWVENNLNALHDYAAAPLDSPLWESADKPWMALAACVELADALIEGPGYVSHLPIAMDGACSGLQHYSALLRDAVSGAAVNLVPADKPGDIYTEVAQIAQREIDNSQDPDSAAWKGKVTRKLAKQPTMTYCYGATRYGMQAQIEEAIKSLGGNVYRDAAYLAPKIRNAIEQKVVAAREAMCFIKALAKIASASFVVPAVNGSKTEAATTKHSFPMWWVAPSGFPVMQDYRMKKTKSSSVFFKTQKHQLSLESDDAQQNLRQHVAASAPNFIHSLDAAHLMETVVAGGAAGLKHFTVVHDSFGVHAADVDTLHACVRETFIEQYTPNVLQTLRNVIVKQLRGDRDALGERLPPVPAMGNLNLAAVRQAQYFFA